MKPTYSQSLSRSSMLSSRTPISFRPTKKKKIITIHFTHTRLAALNRPRSSYMRPLSWRSLFESADVREDWILRAPNTKALAESHRLRSYDCKESYRPIQWSPPLSHVCAFVCDCLGQRCLFWLWRGSFFRESFNYRMDILCLLDEFDIWEEVFIWMKF